LLKLQK